MPAPRKTRSTDKYPPHTVSVRELLPFHFLIHSGIKRRTQDTATASFYMTLSREQQRLPDFRGKPSEPADRKHAFDKLRAKRSSSPDGGQEDFHAHTTTTNTRENEYPSDGMMTLSLTLVHPEPPTQEVRFRRFPPTPRILDQIAKRCPEADRRPEKQTLHIICTRRRTLY